MPTNEEVNTAAPAESSGGDVPVPPPGAPARPPTRRDILATQREQRSRSRPFVILGLVVLGAVLAIPAVAYVNRFVLPPRELAVRVEDKVYTRGDLVNFIRFHQRLSEEVGVRFQIGTSLFEAEETIWQNEIAYQSAPRLGVSVTNEEIDEAVRSLLGYPKLTPEDLARAETQANIREAHRQFLNKVGLSEEVYRDIVRKSLFREAVRERLALDVPRIQPQVHLYEILLQTADETVIQQMKRRLAKGEPIESIAVDVSDDPNVKRTRGEIGWIPRGVIPKLDHLFFGVDEEGNRRLPVGTLSNFIPDSQTQYYKVYFISEYSEAREVDDASFEVLKDKALLDYLNQEFRRLDVHLVLNDRIYAWVNAKVKLASLLPTPTPSTDTLGLFGGQ